MRIAILSLSAALFLIGCTATAKQIKPSSSKAEMLYRSHCSVCHRLRSSDLYTYPKLKGYVDKYGRGLSADERQALLQYLKETAKKQQ